MTREQPGRGNGRRGWDVAHSGRNSPEALAGLPHRRGGRPLKDFVDQLTDEEAATVAAAMKKVAREGLVAARHLRGDLYEVRVNASTRTFRILFAMEGRLGQILLSLSGFVKKTQKTPQGELEAAEARLRDWRRRRVRGPR